MYELDPIRLSSEIGQLDEARVAWEERLRSEPAFDDDPFVFKREFLSREMIDRVRELHESDPLRQPLLRWLFLLIERRVNYAFHVRIGVARYQTKHQVSEPRNAHVTLATMLAKALAAPPERRQWLQGFSRSSSEVSRLSGTYWQRRGELARRLDILDLDALELPSDGVEAAAERWLRLSAELFEEFSDEDFAVYLEHALSADARSGWPSRISSRTLEDWFRDTKLFADLAPKIGALPEPLGGSSFVRALLELGRAFRVAAASDRQPFVVAHDPLSLEAWVSGHLFAGLPRERAFALHKLELGAPAFADHARSLSRGWLFESRWLALKVLLRRSALSSYDALTSTFSELTAMHLGAPLDASVALVLPRLNDDDAQRFAGCMLAELRRADLRDVHDEDWFRNPRAADQLRSEAQLSPATSVSREELDAALDATLAQLQRSLA